MQSLVAADRNLGSRWADLDPLKRQERPAIPELEPAFYDFTEGDHANIYSAANTYFGFDSAPLRDIVKALRDTYCGSIGAEFMYISDQTQKRWIQERLESTRARPGYSTDKKKRPPLGMASMALRDRLKITRLILFSSKRAGPE